MYRSALFFTRICFWVLPISLFGAQSISQAKSKEVLSTCQKTSLPTVCQKLATLYQRNDIPFHIKTPDVCSWDEVNCNHKKQVIRLNLYGRGIKSLPPNIFANLSQLKELNLYGNQLTSLPPDIFSKLSQLQKLYLGANQLTSLPPNIFSNLSKLQELSLGANQLTSLPPNIFSNLFKLQWLSLTGNRLTSLPPVIFSGLSQLQYLYLLGNPLPVNFKLDKSVCKQALVIPKILCN